MSLSLAEKNNTIFMLSVALLTDNLLLVIMNRKVSRKNKKFQRENRRMTHSVRDYNDLHKIEVHFLKNSTATC